MSLFRVAIVHGAKDKLTNIDSIIHKEDLEIIREMQKDGYYIHKDGYVILMLLLNSLMLLNLVKK